MSTKTKIEWTDHSWSPWWGCTPCSPGCARCYASALAKRFRGFEYRKGGPRQKTKNWNEPRRWNRKCQSEYRNARVFPSMCDPFDAEIPFEWKVDFWRLVYSTSNLTWLLLTKRPERFQDDWDALVTAGVIAEESRLPKNVWIGVSVEDQKRADERIPVLLKIPAAVRFLSVEPMLERINLEASYRYFLDTYKQIRLPAPMNQFLHWVIVGGESGKNARPCGIGWVRSIVDQCRGAKLPVFVKQLGAYPLAQFKRVPLKDSKGGDMSEWPEDLRVREFPNP